MVCLSKVNSHICPFRTKAQKWVRGSEGSDAVNQAAKVKPTTTKVNNPCSSYFHLFLIP